MWEFYVYIHYKKNTEVPFYVGMGKLKENVLKGRSKLYYSRAHEKYSTARNLIWHNIARKYGVTIKVVASCKTIEEAHNLEKDFIRQFGRIDLGTGSLANLTEGGEGHSGVVTPDSLKVLRRANMIEYHRLHPELRLKAAAARTKQGGNGGHLKKGDKLPDFWKQAIAKGVAGPRNAWYGKETPISKKVKNTITGVQYPSIVKAAKAENIPLTILYNCLEGATKNKYPHIVRV